VEEFVRAYLAVALSFLVLALLALPFLKKGSASFAADIFGIIMLSVFIALLFIYGRRMIAASSSLAE
jgi:hypothetical protein